MNGVDAKVGETSEEKKDEETNVLRGTLDERESRILQLERRLVHLCDIPGWFPKETLTKLLFTNFGLTQNPLKFCKFRVSFLPGYLCCT